MTVDLLLIAGLLLALANGANDNFKGVATLRGSGTANYRRALLWATICTLLGSLTAVFFAGELLRKFSGKGLVTDALTTNVDFAAAAALGAGATVLVATRVGMPVSTTHGLLGALLGAGLAAESPISVTNLGTGFILPLLLSPLLAFCITAVVCRLLRSTRRRFGVSADMCLCVGNEIVEVVAVSHGVAAMQRASELSIQVGDTVTCRQRYQGQLLGLEAGAVLDWLHYGSAGMVSFARGVNDTPKIAALLLLSPHLSGTFTTLLVGLVIAIGGILSGRRVANTMSLRITSMNHSQGFVANVMTGLTVIAASRLGMPVSMTHVSCGALFGIGTVTGQGDWKVIGKIAGAWLLTLPLGAALGAASLWCIRWLTLV
jgi:PiT family inorganic phosphate transporter